MVTLTELQSAAVAGISAAIPSLAQCEPYAGQFAGDAGGRVAIHAPAVLVAILGCKPLSDPGTGQFDVSCRMAAYVLARFANDRNKREAGCVDLAEAVAVLIHQNNWGLAGVGCARINQLQGMTNITADKAGFSIWSVTWDQDIRLGAAPVNDYGPLTDVRIGQPPAVGAGHEADYVPA